MRTLILSILLMNSSIASLKAEQHEHKGKPQDIHKHDTPAAEVTHQVELVHGHLHEHTKKAPHGILSIARQVSEFSLAGNHLLYSREKSLYYYSFLTKKVSVSQKA